MPTKTLLNSINTALTSSFYYPSFKEAQGILLPSRKAKVLYYITVVPWTILKLILLSIICFYLNSWIGKLDNIYPFIKITLLYSVRIIPFLLLIVMMLDPGFVLNH